MEAVEFEPTVETEYEELLDSEDSDDSLVQEEDKPLEVNPYLVSDYLETLDDATLTKLESIESVNDIHNIVEDKREAERLVTFVSDEVSTLISLVPDKGELQSLVGFYQGMSRDEQSIFLDDYSRNPSTAIKALSKYMGTTVMLQDPRSTSELLTLAKQGNTQALQAYEARMSQGVF